MKPGDVVLIRLPQFGGGPLKLRPALFLTQLPGPYQNILLAGISTHLQDAQSDWDELLSPTESDFALSGLRHASIVRLSYLYSAHANEIGGWLGEIEPQRLDRLRARLSKHLRT
jgi:hypothetical protein